MNTTRQIDQVECAPQKHFADEPVLVDRLLVFAFRHFGPHLCHIIKTPPSLRFKEDFTPLLHSRGPRRTISETKGYSYNLTHHVAVSVKCLDTSQ